MSGRKNKVFDLIYLTIILLLVFFIPLSQKIVVYIIALWLVVWLSEKPWYLLPVFIYVAAVWHTGSAIYIATGLIAIVAIVELLLWVTGKKQFSHFPVFENSSNRGLVLSFSIIYLLYLAGLLYSSNLNYASFDLEVKFSLFIFPLVISTLRVEVLSRIRLQSVFVTYIIGCLISTLICFSDAFLQILHTFSIKEFYYIRLSYYHHPGYMAMFLNLAIAVLISFLLRYKKTVKNRWYTVSFAGLILYFSVFVILLSSKAGILSMLVLYLLTVGYVMVIRKKLLAGLFLILGIGVLFYSALSVFTYSLDRVVGYSQTVTKSFPDQNGVTKETGDRITLWDNALEVLKNNAFIGVGTGDVKDELLKRYKESNSTEALAKELNAHNQFLQTFIALGITGFLALILSLVLPAYYAIKQEAFVYLIFLAITIINFLTESMLETQAGVVFYAFFNSFLLLLVLLRKNNPLTVV